MILAARQSSVQFDTLANRPELTRFPRVAPLGAARPQKRGGEGPTGRNGRGVRGSPGRRRRRAHCQLLLGAICFNCLVWRRTDAFRAKISVRSLVGACDSAAGRVWALSHYGGVLSRVRPCARAVPPAAYGRFLATTRYEGFVAMLPGPVGDRCEQWQSFSAKELVAAWPPSVQPVDIALKSTNYHVRPDEGRGYYSVSKLDVMRVPKWPRVLRASCRYRRTRAAFTPPRPPSRLTLSRRARPRARWRTSYNSPSSS